jgi:EmrB/QacA subfamily drug resistance transporter
VGGVYYAPRVDRRWPRPRLEEPPPLAWVAARPEYPWLVVGTVCVGAFLGQLDASIAGLVLPTLEGAFGAPVARVEWVAIAYLLTLAALVVPFGRLSDLVGRKALYTSGFLVFVGGSALCGVAPGLGWLIAFRVVQAIGAAMLQANSVAIITAAVDRSRLPQAIGVQGSAQAIGLSVGPSLGGLLIDTLGWRWVFFIAVPFGLIGTLLGWLVLPCTPHAAVREAQRAQERFDWLGALLLSPSVALLLLGLTFGNAWGWASHRVLGLCLLTAACLGAFVAAERRAASPLVDLSLLRIRLFSLGLVAGLLSYAVLFGSLFLVPFYLERVLDRTPREAGLLLSPIPLCLGALALVSGSITERFGPRVPTVVGMLVAAGGLLALGLVYGTSLETKLVVLGFLGLGLGLFTPSNNSAIMGSAPYTRLGTAGGILNMTRSLGTSLGVAVTGAILAVSLTSQVGAPVESTLAAPPDALRVAFHETLLFLAGTATLAAACAAVRGAPPVRPTPPAQAVVSESVGL